MLHWATKRAGSLVSRCTNSHDSNWLKIHQHSFEFELKKNLFNQGYSITERLLNLAALAFVCKVPLVTKANEATLLTSRLMSVSAYRRRRSATEVSVTDLDDWEGEINGLLTAVNRTSVGKMPK